MSATPRYPVYVISKGRASACHAAKFLVKDGVRYNLVVEPQEVEAYASNFDRENILVLPFSNLGLGSIPARNWVKNHATTAGHQRHWILDDNIRNVKRLYKGKRIICNANLAFAAVEDFVDRYENIAIAGLNYQMFVLNTCDKPFTVNRHVYSCLLILNSLPHKWRGRYNEDTDICLQVLADGWCTLLVNAFMIDKPKTMTMKGGNAAELYRGDGRLRMARSLERLWPGVVTTKRRFQRPQHVVKDAWKRFDTPLKPKPGLRIDRKPNEYGMKLVAVKPVKSPYLRKLLEVDMSG